MSVSFFNLKTGAIAVPPSIASSNDVDDRVIIVRRQNPQLLLDSDSSSSVQENIGSQEDLEGSDSAPRSEANFESDDVDSISFSSDSTEVEIDEREEERSLIKGLCSLSQSKNWSLGRKEWTIVKIEYLGEGEALETCICGHYPIREVCHVYNRVTGNKAIVGNRCIQKLESNTQQGTHKIFAALKRIQEDLSASANQELIEYVYSKGTLSSNQYEFYLDIWRKKELTQGQESFKIGLNRKIIAAMRRAPAVDPAVDPAPRATLFSMEDLVKKPSGIAAKSVVDQAHQNKIISDRDYDFYTDIIARDLLILSEKQQRWVNDINQKMIANNRKRLRE